MECRQMNDCTQFKRTNDRQTWLKAISPATDRPSGSLIGGFFGEPSGHGHTPPPSRMALVLSGCVSRLNPATIKQMPPWNILSAELFVIWIFYLEHHVIPPHPILTRTNQ
jgi:hypothetical protein